MPKGEGLRRGRWLGADLLEGRRLLSHIASPTGSHVIATTPAQVAPPPPSVHTDPDATGRTSASAGDVEAREAEGVAAATAAASAVSKEGVTIPLTTPGKSLGGPEDVESSGQATSELGRFLRTTYRDEPIAWGTGAGLASGLGSMAHHRTETTLPTPEFNTRTTDGVDVRVEAASARPAAPPPARGPAPSPGSDLLDEFLPSDRASLEEAIDRLLDGLEGIGVKLPEGIEVQPPLSSPLAWGISIASIEMIRRKLRKSSEDEDATDPDRDPAVGFLEFPA